MKRFLKDPSYRRNRSHALLGTIVVFSIIFTFSLSPHPQDLSYHIFAGDSLLFFGIPNGLNVLTNIPFFCVGTWGIFQLLKARKKVRESQSILGYFLGVLLTSIGSAYYHLQPNNVTLLWDRLPMTVAFMSLMGAAFEFRISAALGRRMLPIFLIAGIFSILYWNFTESLGRGDLRPYILIQFGSVILFPLIIWRYPKAGNSPELVVGGFTLYILAKISELLDAKIYALSGHLAGHPIKHLLAAGAAYCIGRFLLNEKPRNN